MRVMARQKRFVRFRNWVQVAFLALWLNPLLYLPGVCGAVYHCHACPASAFACPIGVAANFSAWHLFPFVVVGLLLVVAMSSGSLVCGWACPFGLLQDLLAKVPTPKLRIPSWMSVGRYVVLGGLVIAAPFFLGEDSGLFICRLCPTGTLEAAFPEAAKTGVLPSTPRLVILGLLLVAVLFHRRPWCRVLCPLGGLLALGNRWSLFRLRWDEARCTHCGACAKACPYGVELPAGVSSARCVRCLECTALKCGALSATGMGETPEACAPAEAAPAAR
jgi:polyferredoxin